MPIQLVRHIRLAMHGAAGSYGTTAPGDERAKAMTMSSPMRPINGTKNSRLPAAHLLCNMTLMTPQSASM